MTLIRGIIFDMDGVLIDAREWHYEALNRALALFGHTISREAHLTELDGLPTSEKLHRLSLTAGLPVTLHGFINQMKQHYTLQRVSEDCRPVPEHQSMLADLKQRGYRLAVASNSVRGSINAMLGNAGLQHYLQFTLSNEDVIHGKPHPEIYRKAMSRLGLTPQACVVVEDNPHGIAAAEAAGAHVLRVGGPSDVCLSEVLAFIQACERG